MIGQLPTSLDVGGVSYPIETDYRNILVFLAACSDPELSPVEKLEILMKRLYRDSFSQISQEHLEEAILQPNGLWTAARRMMIRSRPGR